MDVDVEGRNGAQSPLSDELSDLASPTPWSRGESFEAKTYQAPKKGPE